MQSDRFPLTMHACNVWLTLVLVYCCYGPHGSTVCAAGYGGTGCATLCGGFGEDATYGPPGRALSSQCLQCSSQGKTIGFSFDW